MTPKDVPECVDIIASHPVIGPRYGNRIGDLCAAWLRLLRCEAKNANVFHAGGPRSPICGIGVTVYVNDEFLRELKAKPVFWTGPELMKRTLGRNSPILSDRQLREDNSRGGLNLLTWEGCIRPGFETDQELSRLVIDGFVEVHRGFLLKEVISPQIESVERFRWTLQTGGMLWNPLSRRYETNFRKDPKEIIGKPHLVGVARDDEFARIGAWDSSQVGELFDYRPPKCGFSRSEQRMLLMALDGETDHELSQTLKLSVPTVKKMWLSVYRRVTDHLPGFTSDHSRADTETIRRGKEKKRHLVAYLRKHPEELRPVDLKLLRQGTAASSLRS